MFPQNQHQFTINPHLYNKCSQTFCHNDRLIKVTLIDSILHVWDGFTTERIVLNLRTNFYSKYDQYGNLVGLVVEGSRVVNLGHSNPTILQQWANLLHGKVAKIGFYDDYDVTNKLGEGVSGKVYVGIRKNDQTKVAIKGFIKSELERGKQWLAFQNEVNIMKMVDSQYFPKLQAIYSTNKSYYLVMELAAGVNLKSYLESNKLTERDAKHIILEVAKGIQVLHRLGIVHRDIKPENVVYDQKSRKIKILDFGFATFAQQQTHIYNHCGTAGYSAPESLQKFNYNVTPLFDCFSLGVLAYFLIMKKMPYGSQGKKMLLDCKQGKFYFDPLLRVRGTLLDLFKKTICIQSKRWNIGQIIVHQYFGQEATNKLNPQATRSDLLQRLQKNAFQDLSSLNHKMQQRFQQKKQRDRINSIRAESLFRQSHQKTKNKSLYKYHSQFITDRY